MNDEQMKKMMEDEYENSPEEGLIAMLKDFYSRKMRSIAIFVWVWGLMFVAGAVYSGVEFCRFAGDKRFIFGLVFIICMHGITIMKIFSFQFIHTNSIKRELKRLELRIAELSNIVNKK